ncbi:MAG: universal stress protein [Candidatus Rifleibacteriota bacterium]
MIKFDKILVPVDFSEGSELALRYAATFATEYGAQIHLLNVIEEEVLHAGNLSDPLETAKKWEQQNRKELVKFIPEKFNDLDIIKSVKGGLVHETILDYAQENNVSLIVIGAHGKSGFIDSWLGGTSYEIARKAPCAVLTVKPKGKGFVSPDEKAF